MSVISQCTFDTIVSTSFPSSAGPSFSSATGSTLSGTTKYGAGALGTPANTSYAAIASGMAALNIHLFTMEFYYRPTTVTSTTGLWFYGTFGQDADRIQIVASATGQLIAACVIGGVVRWTMTTAAASIVAGAWHEICLETDGTTVRLYVNGVVKGSVADVATAWAGTNVVNLGTGRNAGANFYHRGPIDEYRLTNNQALYGGAYTAHTAAWPSPIAPYLDPVERLNVRTPDGWRRILPVKYSEIIDVAAGAGHVIKEEGASLTQRANINFIGPGVTATDNVGTNSTDVTIPGTAGTAGHTIQDEGTSLAVEANLNFVGAGVAVTDNPGVATVVTIEGAHGIQDEGVPLTQRPVVNFVGPGVTVTDDTINAKTLVTIPGGGALVGNVDGGAPSDVYLAIQNIDGGAPGSIGALIIDGGGP